MKHIAILSAAIAACHFRFAPDKDAGGTEAPAYDSTLGEPGAFKWELPEIKEVAYLEIKSIVLDENVQGRQSISDERVEEYKEAITSAVSAGNPNPFDQLPDEKLPQVFRDASGRCVLGGGFQRLSAHKKAGQKEIKVAIRPGSVRDAKLFALQDNADHGTPRTNKDKLRALKIAFADPDLTALNLPNTEYARICKVSVSLVQKNRPANLSSSRTVTRKGKAYKLLPGKKGQKKASSKASKKSTGKAADKSSPKKTALEELDREIRKITNVIGGDEGAKIRKALEEGALSLTPLEIRAWAGVSDGLIKRITPLITGEWRMKPTKAIDFVNEGLSEAEEKRLYLLAISSPGKVFEKTAKFNKHLKITLAID